MTKIKETIERLEESKEHFLSMQEIDECADYKIYAEAVDAALKEIAERSSGCELCRNYDFSQIGIGKDIKRKFAIYFSGGYSKVSVDKRFNYCPMCGRKLKEVRKCD